MPDDVLDAPDAYVALLTEKVPGVPADLLTKKAERLRDVLSHSQQQAVMFLASNVKPAIPRDAFHPDATVADLLYWLQNTDFLTSGEPRAADRPPRGTYRSANVDLRPIEDPDSVLLYRASLDPRANHRWRYRGATPSPEAFRASLFTPQVLAQFMVFPVDDPAHPIGMVSSYTADLVGGHCSVAAQRVDGGGASSAPESKGMMVEGMFIFFQYLFDHYNFFKIYLELPEYNLSLISGGADSLLVKEAEMKGHFWYGGRRWDQHIYALYQERWEEVAPLFRGEWPDGR